jgi:transcriptional regulator with XRE-family HTH domain
VLLLELLRRQRNLRGIDVERLTRRKVVQREVSNLERGLRPKPEQARALAAAFGLSDEEAAWLFRPIEDLGLAPKASEHEGEPPTPPSMFELIRGRK